MVTKEDALLWIAEVFEEAPEHVTAATPRNEIPGWDSLGILSLIAAFDERFGIQLSEKDINDLAKVDDILEILRGHGKLDES